jgi:anti-sigma B factor antagonist
MVGSSLKWSQDHGTDIHKGNITSHMRNTITPPCEHEPGVVRREVNVNNSDAAMEGFREAKNGHMKLRLQKIDNMEGGLVVYASGYLGTYNSLYFRDSVEKAIETGFIWIVFELGAVHYMSSTGLGCFPHFLKLVKLRNGDIILCRVQPNVYDVFGLLGFSQSFIFKESLAESFSYFHTPERA